MKNTTQSAFAENQNDPLVATALGNQPASPFLARLGALGRVQLLDDRSWLAPVLALHARVRREMSDVERRFLMGRSPDYFRDLLDGRTGCLLGAVVDGRLAGVVAVVMDSSFHEAQALNHVTYPDPGDAVSAVCGQGRVAVIQSLCLLRCWTGRGFSRSLLQAALAWCDKRHVAHVFAQAAEANSLCWLRFLEQDFAIVGRWTNGHSRYLLKRIAGHEKRKKILKSHPQDHVLLNKNYAELPVLVSALTQRLRAGGMLLLDSHPDLAPDKLRVVFERL